MGGEEALDNGDGGGAFLHDPWPKGEVSEPPSSRCEATAGKVGGGSPSRKKAGSQVAAGLHMPLVGGVRKKSPEGRY